MLNVTDKAAAALHETLNANTTEENQDQLLRLTRSGDGLGLALDEERDGDQVISHDDKKILVVDNEISQALDGATIDAVETPEGARLVLETPEAQQQ
jgi:Fe-S cluster assembly iron-binding protein IscA